MGIQIVLQNEWSIINGESRANTCTRGGLRMDMFSLKRRLVGDITVFEYLNCRHVEKEWSLYWGPSIKDWNDYTTLSERLPNK